MGLRSSSVVVLALAGVGLFAGTARAADASLQLVDGLYHCELLSHELLTSYHFFASDAGNPVYRGDVQAGQSKLASCMVTAENGLRAAGQNPEADTLHGKYAAFDSQFRQNYATVVKKGAPEYQVLNTMIKSELDLVAELDQAVRADLVASKAHLRPEAEQARKLAVLIQYATARYVERSTAAAAITIRDDSAEPAIDELAREFDSGLQKLLAGPGHDQDLSFQLATKWHFIQNSLLNYNQKTVPFTVNRQGRALAELLEQFAGKVE